MKNSTNTSISIVELEEIKVIEKRKVQKRRTSVKGIMSMTISFRNRIKKRKFMLSVK